MLSTNELSGDNGELGYREHGGTIVNIVPQEEGAAIAAWNIQVLKEAHAC